MLMGGMAVDRDRRSMPAVGATEPRRSCGPPSKQVQEIGCLVKDLDIGLIDFPTTVSRRGSLPLLETGRSGIEYWHGVDEGFRGRKAIDQDFLDHHQGDRSQ